MTTKDKDKETKKSRESKATYQPPQRLDIPQDVLEKYATEGYALRWIRVRVGNEEDLSHVAKRKREGYIFLKSSECPEIVEHLGLLVGSDGLITNGDLALAKILIERQEARQKYYEDLARLNEQSTMLNLEKEDSRYSRVFNDSRSYERTGRHAKLDK